MRNPLRYVFKPHLFFNQLQFSQNHSAILLVFLFLSTLETHLGRHTGVYQFYAQFLQWNYNLNFNLALWLVTFTKLFLMVAGASAFTWLLWTIGQFLGYRSSRRVLFRRIAVVLTLFLAGHILDLFVYTWAPLALASLGFFLWGGASLFFAIREQFGIQSLQTLVVTLLIAIFIFGGWNQSQDFFATTGRTKLIELARKGR